MRAAGHRGPIGLFLHVPFPPGDVFETLPWADELLEAICAFDLVGFQTDRWAENFTACAHERSPATIIAPVGIDPADFKLDTGDSDPEIIALAKQLGDRKLILGVDRLDYSKGIPERLAAFERLLEQHPEWRRAVTFVQVSVPSRREIADYAELRTRVEHLVGRINGRYGDADWVPVRYLYRSYNQRVLAQLYRLARVALVTPLRDGLNLVAKCFVAAQDERDPGVLVLSRFAGAAVELSEAILTNPYHTDGLAADLDTALRMPLVERRSRQAALAHVVSATTPHEWARTFLAQLEATRASRRCQL
jgi:trehalose 6-phosphate synthase